MKISTKGRDLAWILKRISLGSGIFLRRANHLQLFLFPSFSIKQGYGWILVKRIFSWVFSWAGWGFWIIFLHIFSLYDVLLTLYGFVTRETSPVVDGSFPFLFGFFKRDHCSEGANEWPHVLCEGESSKRQKTPWLHFFLSLSLSPLSLLLFS